MKKLCESAGVDSGKVFPHNLRHLFARTYYSLEKDLEEEIDGGRRQEHIMFPRKAVREMVGNIMIHQDLTVHGAGPMMEVFDTRVESSNPGILGYMLFLCE